LKEEKIKLEKKKNWEKTERRQDLSGIISAGRAYILGGTLLTALKFCMWTAFSKKKLIWWERKAPWDLSHSRLGL